MSQELPPAPAMRAALHCACSLGFSASGAACLGPLGALAWGSYVKGAGRGRGSHARAESAAWEMWGQLPSLILFMGTLGSLQVAVSCCIKWYQIQLILATCHIRYHGHLWDHRQRGGAGHDGCHNNDPAATPVRIPGQRGQRQHQGVPTGGALSAVRAQCNYLSVWLY